MENIEQGILELFKKFSEEPIVALHKLPQAGSDRLYFRLTTGRQTYIATYGENIKENETFIYFADQFAGKQLCTPKVFAISDDKTTYLQQDFGDKSLLNYLEAEGFCDATYALYKESLKQIANLQVQGHKVIDYKKCLTNAEFGKQAIMADLLYFKYYFLDALAKPYDKQKLIDDFEALSNYLSHTEHKYFMFRDFQSRNIMVAADKSVHFIDFQGGMNGAPQYDVASLLWQARANLPDNWKESLLEDYMVSFEEACGKAIDRDIFKSQYQGYVLIRLLQVLGAYGFRGLFEQKAQFLTSIPLALQNLQTFTSTQSIGIAVPEFTKVLNICLQPEIVKRFTPPQADENTPLQVRINSFSFIKNGYPADTSKNGGGFVFDMRGILNPGRFNEYKHLNGKDKPVMDFLDQRTEMPNFLNGVLRVIDTTVEDYMQRGFSNLDINFGCTGGQHRSVYAAEQVARHLKNKYRLQPKVNHINSENWVTVPVEQV